METSLAKRLLGQQCKTQLPTTKELLKLHLYKPILAWQERQAKYYNNRIQDPSPLEGPMMRSFRLEKKAWKMATVAECLTEWSHEVKTQEKMEQAPPRTLDHTPNLTKSVTLSKELTLQLQLPDRLRQLWPTSHQESSNQYLLLLHSI